MRAAFACTRANSPSPPGDRTRRNRSSSTAPGFQSSFSAKTSTPTIAPLISARATWYRPRRLANAFNVMTVRGIHARRDRFRVVRHRLSNRKPACPGSHRWVSFRLTSGARLYARPVELKLEFIDDCAPLVFKSLKVSDVCRTMHGLMIPGADSILGSKPRPIFRHDNSAELLPFKNEEFVFAVLGCINEHTE